MIEVDGVRYVSTKEALGIMKVSRQTLVRLAKKGVLKTFVHNRTHWYIEDEVINETEARNTFKELI